jgi:uncharacterized protein (DUF2461 family)
VRELEQNKSKAWFDENRKRYEKLVRGLFKEFYIEVAARIHGRRGGLPGLSAEQITSIPADPKDGILRINRDLRFAKGKPPYHTYLRAAGQKEVRTKPCIPTKTG